MKALLAAAVIVATASAALAEPWQTDSVFAGEELIGETAYQWEDGGGNVLLGYECDAMWGLEAFYVQTDELYDETAGYAPDVPTSFVIDGAAYPLTGVFQNRDGYLFTYYDGVDDSFFQLFDRLLIAKDSVTVAFYDKSFSFSADGIGRAMSTASELCF